MPDSHQRGIAIRADKNYFPASAALPHAIVYRCSAPKKVFFTHPLKREINTRSDHFLNAGKVPALPGKKSATQRLCVTPSRFLIDFLNAGKMPALPGKKSATQRLGVTPSRFLIDFLNAGKVPALPGKNSAS